MQKKLDRLLHKIETLQIQVQWYSYDLLLCDTKMMVYMTQQLYMPQAGGPNKSFHYVIPQSQWNRRLGKDTLFAYQLTCAGYLDHVSLKGLRQCLKMQHIVWTLTPVSLLAYTRMANWEKNTEAAQQKLQQAIARFRAMMERLASELSAISSIPQPIEMMILMYVYG